MISNNSSSEIYTKQAGVEKCQALDKLCGLARLDEVLFGFRLADVETFPGAWIMRKISYVSSSEALN